MKQRHHIVLFVVVACVWTMTTAVVFAQARGARSGASGVQGGRNTASGAAPAAAVQGNIPDDPFSGPVVTNAPFSADAVTTVTQILGDGTRIEENSAAKFYRDGAGRVRREQSVLGLGALNPSGEPMTVITVDPDPGDATAYTLDPATKTARPVSRSSGAGAVFYMNRSARTSDGLTTQGGSLYTLRDGAVTSYNATLAASRQGDDLARRRVATVDGLAPGTLPGPLESLGTRQLEGVTVVGRRTKTVIPTGQIGNDRPIEITDERWESQDLRLLVRSHHHDPRTGDIEYRLTNIVRVEPPPDLFTVPPDYTISQSPVIAVTPTFTIRGAGDGPGARTGGGARSGGQRSGAPAN